jgi:hypothetical protein
LIFTVLAIMGWLQWNKTLSIRDQPSRPSFHETLS